MRWGRILLRSLVTTVILLAVAAGWIVWELRASLPRVEGRLVLDGLEAPVEVARDARGIPVLRGSSLNDVVRAQGFVHAQERFFQMDLMRRVAAGELAALLGKGVLGFDFETRILDLRRVASAVLDRSDERLRACLSAYAQGVDAGLEDLGAAPPEYLLLRCTPEPWTPEDTVLVYLTLWLGQSLNGEFEPMVGLLEAGLPEPLVSFLTPDTVRDDRPLIVAGSSNGYQPLPIPGPEVVDLRGRPEQDPRRGRVVLPFETAPGSNAWLVAGERTSHGGAILANDPHLDLQVPNTWFRNELDWGEGRAVGVSLPGIPGIAIGSNGHVAWGFTNAMVDQDDRILVELEESEGEPTRYRTPEGWEPLETQEETWAVRGGSPDTMRLDRTRWGVLLPSHSGPVVRRWAASDPERVDLGLFDLLFTRDVDEALAVLRESNGPGFNGLVADREGRIAWTVSGHVPRRAGLDGKGPRAWTAGVGWTDALSAEERPVRIDPPEGFLWSANHRTVPPAIGRALTHVWLHPGRAARIAERLEESRGLDEEAHLALQLDTRSHLHGWYAELLLATLPIGEGDERTQRGRAFVASWNGTADADQPGFRILRAYRMGLLQAVLGPLVAAGEGATPIYNWPLMDEPAMRLLEERPAHLLPPGFADWDALVREAFVDALAALDAREWTPGYEAAWGAVNRTGIEHPLSAVPGLGAWLDMPDAPLPGHLTTVRSAGPGFGASLRLVVSPGREEEGILHMPGGQSGHFLSPHYADGHGRWLRGEPEPLLAGEPVHVLHLEPAER